MSIKENLNDVKVQLKAGVVLVAVSKTRPEEEILKAFLAGQRDFGENKIQELVRKMDALPEEINWHFIGGLQTNKVKYLDKRVKLVHSVDRVKLAEELDKNAQRKNYSQNCLIEINIGREVNKAGVMPEDLAELVQAIKGMDNLNVMGLMAVIPICGEEEQRQYFTRMKLIFEDLKNHETDHFKMEILSMGMSGDFKMAMECGSTMVRIGTAIFGERDYTAKK